MIVFGAGGQGKTAADVIEKQGEYRIIGFIDNRHPVGSEVYGYRVLGDEQTLLAPDIYGGIVAIGDNWARSQVVDRVLAIRPDFTFIRAIHPTSVIARGAEIGEGTLILTLCTISSDARLGRHCFMSSQGMTGHESVIGDFVNIGSHCSISGGGRVGSYSTIGPGAAVLQKVTVGEHTIIGAGSVVVRDIGSFQVAYGTPCKPVRERQIGERYL